MKKLMSLLLLLTTCAATAQEIKKTEKEAEKIEVIAAQPNSDYLMEKIGEIVYSREVIHFSYLRIKIKDNYYECHGGGGGIRCWKMDHANGFNPPPSK